MAVLKENKFERICQVRRAICSADHTARCSLLPALPEMSLIQLFKNMRQTGALPLSSLALPTLISLHDTGFKQFWRDLVGSICSSRLSQLQQLNPRSYT